MKSLWKYSAIAAVAAAGSFAQADVALPDAATGSELVLFVRDTSAGAAPERVYARGLGITVDQVLTTAAAGGAYSGAGQSIPFNLPTIDADTALTTFLGQGSTFEWTIMAADNVGTAAFAQRYVTTTQIDLGASGATIPGNSTLRSSWTQVGAMFSELNANLPDGAGTSTALNGLWGTPGGTYENATNWFGGAVGNVNTLGQSANLFVLATSANNVGSTNNLAPARVFASFDVVLERSGQLHAVTPVGEVPLPPALFLLGSAFAGLAGVARRKKDATAA